MKISRFYGANTRDVMRQVREALGPDALIVSNRSVEGGIEVLATVDGAFDDTPAQTPPQESPGQARPTHAQPSYSQPSYPQPSHPQPPQERQPASSPFAAEKTTSFPIRDAIVRCGVRTSYSGPSIRTSKVWPRILSPSSDMLGANGN